MKTLAVERHGRKYAVLGDEGVRIISVTFEVQVRDSEWFGGFLTIHADDQSQMKFLVPIGHWSPIFGKEPTGGGCVPCGDLEQFRQFLTVLTIAAGIKEAIVQEHIPGQSNHELFRVVHDWDWNDAETLLTEGREDLVTR